MILNLGSGLQPQLDSINVDIRHSVHPDLVCDLECNFPFKDNSFDDVIAADILEHISIGKTIHVMEEIWRVLKPDGLLHFSVPSTDGRGAFQDPTHRSFWNINSFFYYVYDDCRNLYGVKAKFSAVEIKNVTTDVTNFVVHVRGILQAEKGVKSHE